MKEEEMVDSEDLVVGFRLAKTEGSPWAYLSKVRKELGISHSEMEQLISDIKSGIQSRRVGDYSIAFEADSSKRKRYAGSNLMSIMPVREK